MEWVTRQEIDAHFARLKEGFGASPELDAIDGTYRITVTLGPRLDALMTAEQVDWGEARATLVELSIDIGDMHGRLDQLKHLTEEIVYEAGNMTNAGVNRMNRH